MKATGTELDGVLVLEPRVFEDERGWFFEAFNQRKFGELTGIDQAFVQDNQSRSRRNVLRGLHYQVQKQQGKLVRVLSGEIFDVVVDLRRNSASFGKHRGMRISSEGRQMLWIPPGFAHGFLVISDQAEILYKTTDYYAPQFERSIAWDDPFLAIPWPLRGNPILSPKDSQGKGFLQMEPQEMPCGH